MNKNGRYLMSTIPTPPPPYSPPPAGWQPPPVQLQQAPPRNGFGITALVLSLVGLVFSLIPLTGFIAVICGGIAVLFGLLGLGRARRGEATNKKMSIVGTVLGGLALVVGVIGIIIVFTATNKLANDLKQIGQPQSVPASVTAPATLNYTAPAIAAAPEAGPVEPAPTVDLPPANTFTDGEYVVGEDMAPGTYVTQGSADGTQCYWARHKNVQGTAGPIIIGGNHIGAGKSSFLAKNGEVVELSLGCSYTKK
jgi:hypothetical protein